MIAQGQSHSFTGRRRSGFPRRERTSRRRLLSGQCPTIEGKQDVQPNASTLGWSPVGTASETQNAEGNCCDAPRCLLIGWWNRAGGSEGGGACPPSLARPRGARMLRDLGRPSGLPRRTDGGKRLQRRGHGSSPAAGDRSLPQSLGLCYRTNCRSRTGAPQRRNRRTRVGIQLETVSLAAAAPQSRRMGWRTSLPGSPRHLPDSGQDPGGPEDCACAVTALATPRVSTRDTESSLIPHAGRGDPPRHRAPPRPIRSWSLSDVGRRRPSITGTGGCSGSTSSPTPPARPPHPTHNSACSSPPCATASTTAGAC